MATSSSLNPLAQEWRPQGPSLFAYLPHITTDQKGLQYFNLQPPQAVAGFPAAAGAPPQWHYFYHEYSIQSAYVDQQSHCAVKKTAPAVAGRRRDSLRKVALPPRLRATEKTKIWRRKPKSDGSSVVDGGDSSSPLSLKTTVMIRHIPNQYRRDSFMEFLDKYCLETHLQYDFLYLPMDFKTKNNVGYAFVNFTTAAAAAKIRERLQNYRWGVLRTPSGFCTSKKICEVTWARIQGKMELVKHFQKSNFVCDTCDYLPAVFSPPRNGSCDRSEPQPIGNLMGNVRTPCKA